MLQKRPTSLAALLATALLLCLTGASATSLIYYNSCPRLLSFYHAEAIKRASEFARASAPKTRGGPQLFSAAPASAPAAPQADSAAFRAPPEAGTDFSDTDVQVAGVDEPDIIKTDGRRVFALRGKTLSLVRTADGGMGGKVVSTLTLPTFAQEMLIEGDTLLVIGSDYGQLDPNVKPPPPFFPGPLPRPLPRPLPVLAEPTSARLSILPTFGEPITVVYKVSAAGDRLALRDTLRLQGRYISAREVAGVVRLVTSYSPRFFFPWPVPLARGAAAPPAAAAQIRRSSVNAWLPRYRLQRHCPGRTRWCTRPVTALLVPCSRVYHPRAAFSGFGLLSVTTLRMDGYLYPRGGAAVVSNGRDVYATAGSLYVATTVYRNDFLSGPRLGASFRTSVHKFRLDAAGAAYVASGTVAWSTLNQFSMHEHKGVFYVATTEGARWWTGRDLSRSRVMSFKPVGRVLQQLGYVGNLGVGERIFAVRYVQAVAYVVTFRQVDPLYVVDIANPRKMVVTGELKIPGFSSYLHPIGGGKLLGVGRDATPDGRTTGAKVSLFDVSNPAKPAELAAWTLKGSYSSARWDHRAFLYWAPETTAVLPLSVSSRNFADRFTGSIVLKIAGKKIVEVGRFSQPKCCGTSPYAPAIQRNFVLGKTNLWSFSQRALQVNDIRSLQFKSIVNF